MKTARAIFAALCIFTVCVQAQAVELVMFERDGCIWCERWNREIGAAYANTPEGAAAPLRRVNIYSSRDAGLKLDLPVRFTPTFIVADQGREIARITGYSGNATFWGLLGQALRRADDRTN